MKISIFVTLILLFLLLTGCSTVQSTPIVRTEFQEVLIPVVIPIEQPVRPVFNDQSIPVYVNELIMYTEMLEILIYEHNLSSTY